MDNTAPDTDNLRFFFEGTVPPQRLATSTVRSVVHGKFECFSAKPPKDCAVFFSGHLLPKEVEKFMKAHRHLVSPWGTQAGLYLLRASSKKDSKAYSIDFQSFIALRRELFLRFARSAEGNVMIIAPMPRREPAYSMLNEVVLGALESNPKVDTINGVNKHTFVSVFRAQINNAREQYGKKEPDFCATVYRIK